MFNICTVQILLRIIEGFKGNMSLLFSLNPNLSNISKLVAELVGEWCGCYPHWDHQEGSEHEVTCGVGRFAMEEKDIDTPVVEVIYIYTIYLWRYIHIPPYREQDISIYLWRTYIYFLESRWRSPLLLVLFIMAPKTKSVFFGSGDCHLDFTTVSRAFEIQCFKGNLYHWKFSFHTNCWWHFLWEKIDNWWLFSLWLLSPFQETFPEFYKYCCDIGKPDTLASLIFWGHEKLLYPFWFSANLMHKKNGHFEGFPTGFPEKKSAWCLGPRNIRTPVFYPSQIVSTEHLETSENPCDLLITSSEESWKAGPRFWFPGHLWCGLNLLD